MAVSTLELQGMARAVRYLQESATTFGKLADRRVPGEKNEVLESASIRSLALLDAAHQIEQGISRELGAPTDVPGLRAWTVCSACGTKLERHFHGEGCGVPCYDNHTTPCPTCASKRDVTIPDCPSAKP
jgi:hypothetical protein